MRFAILGTNDKYPAWLVRADELLKSAGHEGIVAVLTMNDVSHPETRLSKLISRFLIKLEHGSYNPSGKDALTTSHGGAPRRISVRSVEVRSIVERFHIDVLISESHCSVLLQTNQLPCRIWVLDENWTDHIPSQFVRAWIGSDGYIESTLWQLDGGQLKPLLRTRSQISRWPT